MYLSLGMLTLTIVASESADSSNEEGSEYHSEFQSKKYLKYECCSYSHSKGFDFKEQQINRYEADYLTDLSIDLLQSGLRDTSLSVNAMTTILLHRTHKSESYSLQDRNQTQGSISPTLCGA